MPGVIAWNNLVDSATLSVRSGRGTDTAPLANLKDRRLAKVWKRTVPVGQSKITIDVTFAVDQDVRYAACLNAISDSASGITSNNTNITLLDSGSNGLAYKSVNFTPRVPGGFLYAKMYRNIPNNAFVDFGTTYPHVRTVRFELILTNVGVLGDAIGLGRLWASAAFEFPIGVDKGWSQQMISPETKILRSRSNQVYARPASSYRNTTFQSGVIDASSVYSGATPFLYWKATLQQLAFETAAGQECIVSMDTANTEVTNIQNVYGSMSKPISFTSLAGPYFSASFEHTEER